MTGFSMLKQSRKVYSSTKSRLQKEEALNFRAVKSSDVGQAEQELAGEVLTLEKRKDELEAELKKVNISLAAAHARLRNAIEEREQFDEASNQIVAHLKTKEDELSNSIASYRREADVVNTWINVLEDIWLLQSSYEEKKDKHVNDELEIYGVYLVSSVIHHLSAYKVDLGISVTRINSLGGKLKNLTEGSTVTSTLDDENLKVLVPRKNIEEEYLEFEAKILTTFAVVDNMKEQFYTQHENISRKDDTQVNELFNDIDQIRKEFESIERPTLELETLLPSRPETPTGERLPESPSLTVSNRPMSPSRTVSNSVETGTTQKFDLSGPVKLPLHPTVKVDSESEKTRRNHSTDEISGWEFD